MSNKTVSAPKRPTHSTRTADAAPLISSWAVPTDADDEAWEAATRDQQLSALQDHFASPACTTPSGRSLADIVASARRDSKA